ncbi:MAG: archaemetzincin family Zn-dependent metalloprotease [Methanobacteriota archaeon]
MRLTLKPFGAVDGGVLDHLRTELRSFGDVDVAPAGAVPEDAFDTARDQYRASAFLAACRDEPGDRVLALTAVDMYEHGHTFVFGLADIRGRHAVISLARLDADGRERLHGRALTEAVHELGHTFGLEHDRNRRCVMHFSRSLEDTDRKGSRFCARCAARVGVTRTPRRT